MLSGYDVSIRRCDERSEKTDKFNIHLSRFILMDVSSISRSFVKTAIASENEA